MGQVPSVQVLTPERTQQISIEEEMSNSFSEYALSVIKARALPDVRDGMKPVHRRIIYGMSESGYSNDKAYRKSARIVGDVMGKYHPHGDSAIYDAMVRLAQSFSLSLPLIDGQGNYGSIDGDPPAAMRYTEAKLTKLVDESVVKDIELDTVDFVANYDESEKEPTVLPAMFPNILVNGGEGIAVGMATNIPTHNLSEVVDATLAFLADPSIDIDSIMRIMPGPDFPTAGIIQGRGAIRQAYETGRGSMTVSSVWSIEEHKNGRQSLVFTQLPYQVNKKTLFERIIKLVHAKSDPKSTQWVEGIQDLRDESDRDGIRMVVDIRKDSTPELVLNQLKKYTDIVTTFPMNMVCLDSQGKPCTMGVLQVFGEFINFRREVVARRTRFLLERTRQVLNREVALYAARTKIDQVVSAIRGSDNNDDARRKLMELQFATQGELGEILTDLDPDVPVPTFFKLSIEQTNEVLEMKLSRLTKLNIERIVESVRAKLAEVRNYLLILNNPNMIDEIIRNELQSVKDRFYQPRRTKIESAGPTDISDDDLVEDKQVILTLTRSGYIKLSPLDSYREQNRGGKGKSGMETKDDDVVLRTMICSTRTNLIFFTTRGVAHQLKAYRLPIVAPNAKGRPIVNFIGALRPGETIATIMAQPDSSVEGQYMIFVTDGGDVRLNRASDFENVNRTGKIAMKLEDENGQPLARLIDVLTCTQGDDLVLATRSGKVVRFDILEEIRVMASRSSTGVTGVKLSRDDQVIGASILRHFDATAQERDAYFSEGKHTWKDEEGEHTLELTSQRMQEMKASEQFLLVVSSRGYGKRFSSLDFRTTGRGTQGVSAGNFSELTGNLIACFPVDESDGLVMITNGGQTIRIGMADIRVMGRATRGVRLFALAEDQEIVDIARVNDPDINP